MDLNSGRDMSQYTHSRRKGVLNFWFRLSASWWCGSDGVPIRGVWIGPGRQHRSFPRTRTLERSYRVAGRKHRGDGDELAGGIIFPPQHLHPSPKTENSNTMGSFDLSVTSSHHTRYVNDRDMVMPP